MKILLELPTVMAGWMWRSFLQNNHLKFWIAAFRISRCRYMNNTTILKEFKRGKYMEHITAICDLLVRSNTYIHFTIDGTTTRTVKRWKYGFGNKSVKRNFWRTVKRIQLDLLYISLVFFTLRKSQIRLMLE